MNSLRLRVLMAAGSLLVFAITLGVLDLRNALRVERDAHDLQIAAKVQSDLTLATFEFTLARSYAQVMLSVPSAQAGPLAPLLQTQSVKADAALDRALANLPQVATTRISARFMDEMAAVRREIAEVRQALGSLIDRAPEARPAAEVAGAIQRLQAAIASLQSLRLLLRDGRYEMGSKFVMLEQVRDLAWVVREYAGRERTHLVIATMTRAAIDAATLAEARQLDLRARDALADIDRLAAHGMFPPEIDRALVGIRAAYLGTYQADRRRILDASRAGRPIDIDGQAFFQSSAAALDGIAALSTAADRAIEALKEAEAAEGHTTVLIDAGLLMVAVGLGLFLLIVVVRQVFARYEALRCDMERLAASDLERAVAFTERKDEVGSMARSLAVFRQALIDKRAIDAAQARARDEAEAEARRVAELSTAFEQSVAAGIAHLRQTVRALESSGATMRAAAAETVDEATGAARATESAAASVASAASGTEEIAASIGEIARQVTGASQLSRASAESAQQANTVVRGLANAAQQIGTVVGLISDIAGQTNLLALNATIEAARAGDAGKGFAVVASEVKNLATQTANATGEIGAQVDAIQSESTSAVTSLDHVASTIREVDQVTASIASAVEEQGAATNEISTATQQAARNTTEVSDRIQRVVDTAERTTGEAAKVIDGANDLSRAADRLSGDVERFLAGLKRSA
jgi:methyl-accepting chemotaxis protein